jgi:hypothetical protein
MFGCIFFFLKHLRTRNVHKGAVQGYSEQILKPDQPDSDPDPPSLQPPSAAHPLVDMSPVWLTLYPSFYHVFWLRTWPGRADQTAGPPQLQGRSMCV